MKIKGHPIHLMLIHFPSALFPLDLLCSVLARVKYEEAFLQASSIALMAGVSAAWLAMLSGLFDLEQVMHKKPGSLKKALWHGGINGTVIAAYSILAYKVYNDFPQIHSDPFYLVSIKFILVALMLFANFLGGSLVLKDKVLEEN